MWTARLFGLYRLGLWIAAAALKRIRTEVV